MACNPNQKESPLAWRTQHRVERQDNGLVVHSFLLQLPASLGDAFNISDSDNVRTESINFCILLPTITNQQTAGWWFRSTTKKYIHYCNRPGHCSCGSNAGAKETTSRREFFRIFYNNIITQTSSLTVHTKKPTSFSQFRKIPALRPCFYNCR